MLSVDLHMHTLRSNCGLHTLLEMLDASVERGLEAVAVTDHGPFLKGPGVTSVFVKRFPSEYKGMRVWKGIEANVLPDGRTDVRADLRESLDLILLGLHNLPTGESRAHYTDLLLACLEKNPYIDIIVHPDISFFPLDLPRVAAAAAEYGMAVEFNNANLLYDKTDTDAMRTMAEAVVETGCRAVISSDAHSILEIGCDERTREELDAMGFGDLQFVNDSVESAEAFIEERRATKRLGAPVRTP